MIKLPVVVFLLVVAAKTATAGDCDKTKVTECAAKIQQIGEFQIQNVDKMSEENVVRQLCKHMSEFLEMCEDCEGGLGNAASSELKESCKAFNGSSAVFVNHFWLLSIVLLGLLIRSKF